jgi:DNA/RNA endonuclease YhcR with UshA esterase domain
MRAVAYLTIGAALLAASAAYAHHSYAATYDVSNEVKLEGKLVQFVYRNPHSFVHVQAPDETGTQQRWAVEWAGTGQLAEAGVTRETLKVGDQVVIVGRPSRVQGEYRALMVKLTRPSDGLTWGVRAGQQVD